MFINSIDFITCIRDNLKDKRFSKARIDTIVNEFNERFEFHRTTGLDQTQSNLQAMHDVFDNMSRRTAERAKRTAKMLAVQASNKQLAREGVNAIVSNFLMDGKRGSKGVAVARALISRIEDDPRFTGLAYTGKREIVRGQLFAIFGDVLDKTSKGAFGRQKGKAHLPNIIREIEGKVDTGDTTAKEFATAWQKISDLTVDLFNQAGGSMSKLARFVPQGQNAVRMARAGQAHWVRTHLDALDWDRTRWPDGSIIEPSEREGVLKKIFETLTSDGVNKMDDNAFRGRGRALGNQLEQHRFMHYKDADAWLKVHEEFGDGSIFDVFVRHIDMMSHRIALVDTFGPNPELTANNMAVIGKKITADLSPRDKSDFDAVMKNKFDPMFETIMRQNPMDPHSTMGALVTGTANILTAAQLGSASFLAIPGDFMQTVMVRALNGMGLFGGVDFYVKSLATDPKFMREIATQSGFVMDEVVMSTYATQRWTGVATVGPAITRRISEATMRASLLSGHTRAARWAVQAEFMGLMQRSRNMAYDELPFVQVMQRYGVTKADWDAFRGAVQPWTPRRDVNFLRPIDILKTDVADRQEIYQRLQGMIFEESRKMVPEATIEASVALKDTTRPDRLVGSLLYSFAMYKNFPVSFNMIYGRLAMSSPSVKGRLGFIAGMGAGMVLVGALGTQLREMSKGREPLPMDNAAFLGKALLSGGALSIYGDFLFSGINEFGRGPQDTVAGPLVAFAGDTTELVLGDVFQWAGTVGTLGDDDFKSKTAARAVEWAKRYTPGSSLWWARLALEREVFDRLAELADPKAYEKRKRRVKKQKDNFGNDYWLPPGKRTGLFGD